MCTTAFPIYVHLMKENKIHKYGFGTLFDLFINLFLCVSIAYFSISNSLIKEFGIHLFVEYFKIYLENKNYIKKIIYIRLWRQFSYVIWL